MIYKISDFKNCQFNPLIENDILDSYPVIKDIIESSWHDEALDSILRFIILVYDPKSPLVANERDLNYRKDVAIQLAKIDADLVPGIIELTHPYCVQLAIKYLIRFPRSKEWAAICAFESSFWESIKEIIVPISGKNSKEILDSVQKKAAIKDEIDKDIKRLDQLYRQFLGEDTTLLEKAKRRLTPEAIAAGK